ncbi:hypothetical protein Zmor_013770 [Zophobas morio]|uniref:Uncharacterized protein n=1 Tax=Zophobas morio TaxID=2755281 RepID=A0AA38MFY1_9CUCU|nr:hypothetical protein Zmor_013770 [Zophobas morio]
MAMKLIQFLVAFVLVAAFFIKPSDCGIFGLGALPLCLAGCEAARAGCIAGISIPSGGAGFLPALAACNAVYAGCVPLCYGIAASPF